MTPKNIALDAELYEKADRFAQTNGITVDELANDAVRRELLRRDLRGFIARNRQDAEQR